MALRDQPYIQLYVQDFLADEKLNECSAESVGVYIMLMCVMHKSKDYGAILLKQKDQQSGSIISDFALKLTKHLPFDAATIERSLIELLEEGVIEIEGEKLFQRRMVRDGELSNKRSAAGKSRANNTGDKNLLQQNHQQNSSKSISKTQASLEQEKEIKKEKEKEKEINKEKENAAHDMTLDSFSDVLKPVVEEWLKYKQEKRQSYKSIGLHNFLAEVRNSAARHGEAAVISQLRRAMANNWQGAGLDRLGGSDGNKQIQGNSCRVDYSTLDFSKPRERPSIRMSGVQG